MLISFETFFGRFHPLIVHLPIGFLVLAVFFSLVSLLGKYRSLRVAVPVSFLMGSLSAVFACVTGYMLSLAGDYDSEVLSDHMWAGIVTAFISFIAYLVSIKKIPLTVFRSRKTLIAAAIIIFIFINITGHLGGSLTHGSDYISASVLTDDQQEKKRISDINEAYVFADLVQPILENKCGTCHNESKKKGKLSVASLQALLKGGKHGAAVKPGDLAESELIKRISLNPKNKKYMPTEGKTPLTESETAIIKWWIEKSGAGDDKKLVTANPPENITKFAAAWYGVEVADMLQQNSKTPDIKAAAVSKNNLEKLKHAGFVIKYLNYSPDLLDVTLPDQKTESVTGKLQQLLAIKDNVLWLNISGTNASDADMDVINQFKNLQRLRLDKNPITNSGITKLQGLQQVRSLNLYGTNVTKDCLPVLRKMEGLKTAYTGETKIAANDIRPADSTFKIIGAN